MGELDRSRKTRARRQQQEWGKQNSVHILPPTNKGRQPQIRGWSNAGMRRYRELVHMVRADRENIADKDSFEAGYKANYVKEREVALNFIRAEAQQ